MATTIVYATQAESKLLTKTDGTYSNVTGATSSDTATDGTSAPCGQYYDGISDYTCRQMLVGFEVPVISGIIQSITFSVYINGGGSGKTGSLDLIAYDYGAAIDVTDYVTAAEFSAETILATFQSAAPAVQRHNFTSNGSELVDAVTLDATNRFIVTAKEYGSASVPSGLEDTYNNVFYGDVSTENLRPALTIVTSQDNSVMFGTNF